MVSIAYSPSFRVSRILRAYILLQKSRTVRSVALNILRTIPKMTPVVVFTSFLTLVYALLGTAMFAETVYVFWNYF